MRMRNLLLALVMAGAAVLLAIPGVPAAPTPSKDKVDQKTIDKFVEQLGDDSQKVSEKAYKELDKIGEPALKALEKACQSKDLETKKSARKLVDAIEARVLGAKLLAPKMVELSYKNKPLKDAIADFNKKSGYLIVLHDP